MTDHEDQLVRLVEEHARVVLVLIEEMRRQCHRADVAKAEVQRLIKQQLEEDAPLCEFCANAGAMHVCSKCWNSSNNDTQRRRAMAAEAEVQRLTRQQAAERVSSEPFDGAMLRSGPNGTREWFGPAPEASPSVDAVDPSAGTQERGPRAHEDL